MKSLTVLALFALTGVALAGNIYEEEGHLYQHKERTGVFKEEPFVDLYKQYSMAFVVPTIEPKPDHDDPRYYRPSGDVCKRFFITFVNDNHQIHDFDQFVVLDACLGYVMDGAYKEEGENLSERDKESFAALAEKEEIKSLYKTRLGSATPAEKTCVADLLLRAVLLKREYPSVVCNNHMIQNYLQFAECQEGPEDAEGQQGYELLNHKSDDPYVSLVYKLLRDRVDVCMDQEVAHIENAVREKYAKKWRLPLGRFNKGIKRQQYEYRWPNEVVNVLAAVQNATNQINLRQVHQLLASLTREDEKMTNILMENLAEAANKKIKPRREASTSPKSPAFNDPTGTERYANMVDRMCNPFRLSTSESDYNFGLSLIRMVQLLRHKDLFNINDDSFLRRVVKQTREAVPVYFSVFACNLMTFTQGSYSNTGTGKPKYTVSFKPDTRKMVVWPTAEYI